MQEVWAIVAVDVQQMQNHRDMPPNLPTVWVINWLPAAYLSCSEHDISTIRQPCSFKLRMPLEKDIVKLSPLISSKNNTLLKYYRTKNTITGASTWGGFCAWKLIPQRTQRLNIQPYTHIIQASPSSELKLYIFQVWSLILYIASGQGDNKNILILALVITI